MIGQKRPCEMGWQTDYTVGFFLRVYDISIYIYIYSHYITFFMEH